MTNKIGDKLIKLLGILGRDSKYTRKFAFDRYMFLSYFKDH